LLENTQIHVYYIKDICLETQVQGREVSFLLGNVTQGVVRN